MNWCRCRWDFSAKQSLKLAARELAAGLGLQREGCSSWRQSTGVGAVELPYSRSTKLVLSQVQPPVKVIGLGLVCLRLVLFLAYGSLRQRERGREKGGYLKTGLLPERLVPIVRQLVEVSQPLLLSCTWLALRLSGALTSRRSVNKPQGSDETY